MGQWAVDRSRDSFEDKRGAAVHRRGSRAVRISFSTAEPSTWIVIANLRAGRARAGTRAAGWGRRIRPAHARTQPRAPDCDAGGAGTGRTTGCPRRPPAGPGPASSSTATACARARSARARGDKRTQARARAADSCADAGARARVRRLGGGLGRSGGPDIACSFLAAPIVYAIVDAASLRVLAVIKCVCCGRINAHQCIKGRFYLCGPVYTSTAV